MIYYNYRYNKEPPPKKIVLRILGLRDLRCGISGLRFGVQDFGLVVWSVDNFGCTYQNLQKNRVPINSIFGFITGTYKKVGFGRLRYSLHCSSFLVKPIL